MSNPFPTSKFEMFLLFMLVFGSGVIGIITAPFRFIRNKFKKDEQSEE